LNEERQVVHARPAFIDQEVHMSISMREEQRRKPFLGLTSEQAAKLPWWAFLLIAIGLLLAYLIFANTLYKETFIFLVEGIKVTLRMTLTAFSISLVIGLLVGLARTSKNIIIYNLSTLYVEAARGIPLIVLLLYVAFILVPAGINLINGLGEWGITAFPSGILNSLSIGLSEFSIRQVNMELRAIVALSIGYGAYEAEVFRAGIQSIGRGQMEAARAVGMTYLQAMRLVILPQAFRRILPPLGNDFIAMLKDSSLATVLAVREITQLGRLRRASTFRVFETFNVVSFLYLAMTLLLSALVRVLEQRMKFEE
jgi:polar amino acid transport system permease protein